MKLASASLRSAVRGIRLPSRPFRPVQGASFEVLERRRLLSAVTLAGTTGDDVLEVRLDSGGTHVEFVRGGAVITTEALATLGAITVNAGTGNDRLKIDFSVANLIPAGLTYNAGNENDVLEIAGREGVGTIATTGSNVTLDCDDFYATDSIVLSVGSGKLTFTGSQKVDTLSIGAGAVAELKLGADILNDLAQRLAAP